MKKIWCLIPLLLIALLLSACGAENAAVEDCEWELRMVMRSKVENATSENDLIVAVGGTYTLLYPSAKAVDVTVTAKDGKITVKDATNNKTHEGTYRPLEETKTGTEYVFTFGEQMGYGLVELTEASKDTTTLSFAISIGEYSLYLFPKTVAE